MLHSGELMNVALICRIFVDISSYPCEPFDGNFFIIDSILPEEVVRKMILSNLRLYISDRLYGE
jgi:hypothetical protein